MASEVPKTVLVFSGSVDDGYGASFIVRRRIDGRFDVDVNTRYPRDASPLRSAPSLHRNSLSWDECVTFVTNGVARYGSNVASQAIRVAGVSVTVQATGTFDEILREENLNL
jgi:hypothetical protein